jgi:hypothetical protein
MAWVKNGGSGLVCRPSGLPSIVDVPLRRRAAAAGQDRTHAP